MLKTNRLKNQNEWLLIVMMLTVTLSSMSILLFNFVLPVIRDEFQLTSSEVSWVTVSYTLLYGIGTAIYGKLADRYKLKNILTFGLLIFSAASLFGMLSTSYGLLLFARCLQAVGAATIPATATLIPIRYFPVEQRGKAMGTVFAGVALGNALGPITSAMVVSILDWRWLFSIPLLLLFTLPIYYKFLGDERIRETKIDWLGGGLLAIGIAQILLAVTVHSGWFIGGLIALLGFVLRIRFANHPFIQPTLFQNREYTYFLVLAFVVVGIGYSLFFTMPLLLADVHALPANIIALVMVPAATVAALLNRQGGKLADRKGASVLFSIASALLILCFFLLSLLVGTSGWLVAILLIFGYVGQSFMSIGMSRSISLTLPSDQSGVGMGLLMMQNFIAGSFAMSIYSRVIDMEARSLWNPWTSSTAGINYSNLFFVLAVLSAIVFLSFILKFRKTSHVQLKKAKQGS